MMRKYLFGLIFTVFASLAAMASAQQPVWIQIEAQRSLGRAQEVARAYSANLQSVNGFAMNTGWYAIALGPFSPSDAQEALQQLRITRQIPQDSYIVDGRSYRRQFWPIGAAAIEAQPVAPPVIIIEEEPVQETVARPPVAVGETLAEARQSEKLLNREERELIQIALKWQGFYRSAIDGAFGPGTRKSMSAWQEMNGFEATGVLTSAQRRALVAEYQEALASLGMQKVTETTAGIEIDLPLNLVQFVQFEPPFVQFQPRNDSGVQILLISQRGDDATLRGLYDIMQTLEIVPLEGPREIRARSFTLTGADDKIVSHTFAALSDGQVKGFTLVWPAGDEKRRKLALAAMEQSFRALPEAVLPDVYGDNGAAQSLDLLAGLAVRRPAFSRSGFYVAADGSVLTSAEAVASCERVTLDDALKAEVAAVDPELGLALLRPSDPLAPLRVAELRMSVPRLNSEIAISGYSYEGVLGAPTLTYGRLQDLRGLKGEESMNRLSVDATPADSGGPVFDATGAVVGMLLAPETSGSKRLPGDVRFAADADTIAAFLEAQGIEAALFQSDGNMAPEDLTLVAADMTVLVSCWN